MWFEQSGQLKWEGGSIYYVIIYYILNKYLQPETNMCQVNVLAEFMLHSKVAVSRNCVWCT